jgi:putative transposase
MDKLSYHRHRFPGIVIQQAVWLYFRFGLSYRDVEDMLAERGIDVSYETVRAWILQLCIPRTWCFSAARHRSLEE